MIFKDIKDGVYSFDGINENDKYVVSINGDDASLWVNNKKNKQIKNKVQIQKMLTLPIYSNFKRIKR